MADQHSNEHMSRDNVADGSLEPESTVVTNQHSDEGVDIADVVLESLKSKGVEDNKNSDEDETMGKETVVADKHSDKGERLAEVALESLKSKGAADKRSDDQGENIDEVALDSMKDKRSDEGERIAEVALETLKSKAAADQRSNEDENTADQTALEKLKSKEVADKQSDAGESIAEVVIETLKSKGVADKDSDEGAVKTNATVKTSESTGSNSQSTLEINIKTLDSQLHSFTVNKNMPVSIFKETIASDVGLPVEQQRLIFRGKALKDEDRLSEYHLENGHTLHLVETTARSSNTGHDDVTSARPHVGHVSHSVVLGTFGAGDQDEGSNPDVNQVIGAVLNFLGNENGNQSLPGSSTQSMPQGAQIHVPAVPTLATPIPESLHTLSEFMNHMERALSQNSNTREGIPSVELPSNARGLPSPAALAVVMRQAQRLLSGPAIDSLSQTARMLEEEEGSNDVTVRTRIQTEVVQSGLAMQHLGALLLELGRTMLALRIGQSPAESSVNAGPAVYISPSGPNPIMVQPFPLQTSSLFGDDTTSATMNHGPFGPVGIGPVSRHLNIHIHSGSRVTNVGSNQGAHANANAGINSQTRGVGDHIGSGNQSSLGQANAALPEVRTDAGGTRNAANSSARMKSLSETEGGSSSARRNIPLGLGPGGLQPKIPKLSLELQSQILNRKLGLSNNRERHRQTRSEAANQNLPSPGGQQLDPATIMNQAVQNPALNNLLAGVSNQPGAGSQDFFRNLTSQLAHNPQMMSTVNQFANQMDGNQDLNSMMAGMGGSGASGGPGGSGASGSGKFSSLVHQMMPFITQSLNSGNSGSGSGSSSKSLQSAPSRKGTLHRRNSSVKSLNIKERSSDFQMNLENAAQKIVEHYPPLEIFSSVVETAAALRHNVYDTSAISDLCMEEELAQEFIEMLKRDIARRLQ